MKTIPLLENCARNHSEFKYSPCLKIDVQENWKICYHLLAEIAIRGWRSWYCLQNIGCQSTDWVQLNQTVQQSRTELKNESHILRGSDCIYFRIILSVLPRTLWRGWVAQHGRWLWPADSFLYNWHAATASTSTSASPFKSTATPVTIPCLPDIEASGVSILSSTSVIFM